MTAHSRSRSAMAPIAAPSPFVIRNSAPGPQIRCAGLKMVMIVGHTRLVAAKALGLATVPV
ncbi:MAG: hypothetical protein ACO4AG_10360, partial [Candidatus Nanopelagicales bacterium]